MPNPTFMDDAWAAGLFEGEGSIQLNKNRVRLTLGMTDRDVVERFHEVIGAGKIRQNRHTVAHYKLFFEWYLNRQKDVHLVMARLLPYLGERRRTKWFECLELRAAALPAISMCPQCETAFQPIRHGQVCCGHDCSWRYSARIGSPYTNRNTRKRKLEKE